MNAKTYHAMADRTPTISDGEFVLAHSGREGTNWRAVTYLDAAENGKWKFWQAQPDIPPSPNPRELTAFMDWLNSRTGYAQPFDVWNAALAWERGNGF